MAEPSTSPKTQPSVLIIGTGFGGLGMAMELQKHGLREFTILERAADLGGVWRENTYPGAGCDIPSPLYSYSYEPKTDWPRRFSMQADIQAYMREVSDRRGLTERIRFNSEVTDAEYDEQTNTWTVRTTDGTEYTADVLVNAVGQLSRPALPAIPGIETFTGPAFHSAEWDHSIDLTGKTVAVVGTGASAVQFVPAIQPQVKQMTVFQRSAAWIVGKKDVEYTKFHHWLFKNVPPVRLIERFAIWLLCEFLSLGLVDVKAIQPLVIRMANKKLEEEVADPELRAKLTPDYPAGCKRGLFSNAYYPALCQPNVTVETTGIESVTPNGVRTTDGVEHAADVIVYGTGFKATEFLWPMNICGRGGRKLADVWNPAGGRAYLGMAVPEFPNMFIMYGPNTNLGVGSIVYMLESQARYIRQAVQAIAARPDRPLAVRADVEEQFDRKLQARLDRSPWNFCSSWYRNASGRITNNWPGTVTQYRLRTRKLDLADYEERKAS